MTTRILSIAYEDITLASRSQESVRFLGYLGDVVVASYSPGNSKSYRSATLAKGKRSLPAFISDAVKLIIAERPDVLFLRDFYTAPLILLAKILSPSTKVVYDSAELNLGTRPRGLKSRALVPFKEAEARFLKKADVVIAANNERAEIMRWAYGLPDLPMVVENIHRLDDHFDAAQLERKFSGLFPNDDFIAFHSGGIGRDRLAYELADAFGRLGNGYRLVVAGNSTSEQRINFELYLSKHGIQNVYIVGRVAHAELRYLVQRSDVCVSTYHESSLNTRYCASGKIYEGMFEGKPILVSDNPPLKRVCETYTLGVSTSDFEAGMKELENDYHTFVRAVVEHVDGIDPETLAETRAYELSLRLSRAHA